MAQPALLTVIDCMNHEGFVVEPDPPPPHDTGVPAMCWTVPTVMSDELVHMFVVTAEVQATELPVIPELERKFVWISFSCWLSTNSTWIAMSLLVVPVYWKGTWT